MNRSTSDDIKDQTICITKGSTQKRTEAVRDMQKRYATLIVVEGEEIGREFRLRKSRYYIGRGLDASIHISGDKKVSRKHACLQIDFDATEKLTEYALVDLDSTNHTYVNGDKISIRILADGDKIRVGDTVLKFMLQDKIDAQFHKEIQRRINYDSLTGLLTRSSFELAMNSELDRCQNYDMPLSLLMMDLDHFKKVNDTYGHLTGSSVLSEVGMLIRNNFRAIDISGRYGGEEFVTFLSELDADTASIIAERMRKTVREHDFKYDNNLIKITISIGISMSPDHGNDFEALVANADKALYRAKNSGRDKVIIFDSSIDL